MLFKQKAIKASAEAMQVLEQAKAAAQIALQHGAYLAAKIDGIDVKKNWKLNHETLAWEPHVKVVPKND